MKLGFKKSKKSQKEKDNYKEDKLTKYSHDEENNTIVLIGEATFREESFASQTDNAFESNPDESPIGISDRDGMNVYGRPRQLTEQNSSVLQRMDKTRSISSQSKLSSEEVNQFTDSESESGGDGEIVPALDESMEGEVTKNQMSMMNDMDSVMDVTANSIDQSASNTTEGFSSPGFDPENVLKSPVSQEEGKKSGNGFEIKLIQQDEESTQQSSEDTKDTETSQNSKEMMVENTDCTGPKQQNESSASENENENGEPVPEVKMKKKETAELVETEKEIKSQEEPKSKSQNKNRESENDEHDSDASSVESGEPFEGNNEEEQSSVESTPGPDFVGNSDSEDSGILKKDEFENAPESEGSVDYGDDVDALLENYEENEFIGMDDDERKRKKSGLDAIQEEDEENEATDGSTQALNRSEDLRTFLESEETPVEARQSLLNKGYTEDDIKRLEELRASMIEAKEYNEMKRKQDPTFDEQWKKDISTPEIPTKLQIQKDPLMKLTHDIHDEESIQAESESENIGDETLDFVNMITNGYNDIVDLGEKLQGVGNQKNTQNSQNKALGDKNLNRSGLFSKINDNEYIQNELSRITFLHSNSDLNETNLRNCKIKIETFPADYDLEGNFHPFLHI